MPKDNNPFSVDPEFAPRRRYALGFKNPWCSFGSGKPSYGYCTDVGQVTIRTTPVATDVNQ
jgi:hypothetical protein